ncbi:MAG TPA: hypothetical protein VEV39_02320 [Gemmatimonadales bacterium]|nr:hypothetical protein [Gemmatimonadales bacterium]
METRLQAVARHTLARVVPPAMALVAGLLAFWITAAPGPGLEPDSMSYAGSAEWLARHGTLAVPTAYWWESDSTSALGSFPPGYPLAISVPIALGVAPVQGARLVIVVAAMLTAWALASAAFAAGGWIGACLAALLALLAPGVVTQHWIVLSEPLSYALLAITLGLMASRPERAWAYGLTAALANLVRYAEVASVVVVVIWAFVQPAKWRVRVRRAAVAGIPAVALQGAWLLRERLVEARTPFATVGTFGGMAGTVGQGIGRIGAWLVPSPILPNALIPLAVLVMLAVLWLVHRTITVRVPQVGHLERWLLALLLFSGVYASILLFSRRFVGGEIEFDDRILSPLYVCGGAAVGTMIGYLWDGWTVRRRWVAGSVVAAWMAAAIVVDVGQVRSLRTDGYGYEGADWQKTDFAQWLRTVGSKYDIYSNDPAAIYFLTGRPSRMLPETLAPDSVARFRAVFDKHPSLLVGFQDDYRQSASPAVLAREYELWKLKDFDYGTAWGVGLR